MERRYIEDYLLEFQKFEIPYLVEREVEITISNKFIISIIGPRRAGKTFYFYQLLKTFGKEICLYLNFEDSRLIEISYKDIREIIRTYIELFGKEPTHLFFDEVQNIENWEITMRELYDKFKYFIFVTGSSSKLLSKEISTQLRGRALSYLLLPFSFREFLKAKNVKIKDKLTMDEEAKIKNLLREYLEFGGFPQVIFSNEKVRILKEFFNMILFRDIVERHEVKNIHLVNLLFNHLVLNFSKEISTNKFYREFKSKNVKVSKDTLYKYLTYFEDSVGTFFVRTFSEKVRVKEFWPKKVYLCDTGLSKIVRFSEDIGKLMENCVFLELKRHQNKDPLLEIYYYKANGKEVDFVIKRGTKIIECIQTTYGIGEEKAQKREIEALLKSSKELKCNNLVVITWDYESNKKVEGKEIKFIPLWKWLLL